MKNANATTATTANFSSKEIAHLEKDLNKMLEHIYELRARKFGTDDVEDLPFTASEARKLFAYREKSIAWILELRNRASQRAAAKGAVESYKERIERITTLLLRAA